MKFCILISFLLVLTPAKSQQSLIKPSALGVHFFGIDFTTALKPGLAVSYLKGLSNHFDLSITMSGSFISLPVTAQPLPDENHLLLQLTTMSNLKLNSDNHFFSPYITGGISVSKYQSYYGMSVPAGLGIQFSFKEEVYILLQSQYAFKLVGNIPDHLYHSIGIAGNIGKKKRVKHTNLPKPAVRSLEAADRDGDSLLDSLDRCPEMPGLLALQGCPDTDGDGILDKEDRCPAVPGILKYAGCPIPDSDGDGLNDEEDSCIHDPGPASNNGCPGIEKSLEEKVNLAAKNIFFETGKAILLPESFTSLDEVTTILLDHSSYRLIIEGYTDNVGKPQSNQLLSENRAKAVLTYFLSKGIEANRMTAKGFGQDKPVADNNTVEGRSKNRRVEMKINF